MHDSESALVLVDDRLADLSPLDDLRPVWDVRSGAYTTRRRIEQSLGRQALAGVSQASLRECSSDPIPSKLPQKHRFLLINGRCVLPPRALRSLSQGSALVDANGGILAVEVDAAGAQAALDAMLRGEPTGSITKCQEPCLLEYPWDVVRYRDAAIQMDIQNMLRDRAGFMSEPPDGVTVIGSQPLAIDLSAVVCPSVVLDVQFGPVVIGKNATIRPGAILVGPCVIGADSTVLEHALIKANTAIGPVCKVAGEVGGTIFQGHANKAHHGHLGDSWVGEWVNLGAGTVNSNLLNTYTEVTAQNRIDGSHERTGMMFLGAIVGDHVKTAIGTRLMTGTVLGTGCMIASTAATRTCAGAFSWITDSGCKPYRMKKFLEVAAAVMARRDVQVSEAYAQRLHELYEQRCGGAS